MRELVRGGSGGLGVTDVRRRVEHRAWVRGLLSLLWVKWRGRSWVDRDRRCGVEAVTVCVDYEWAHARFGVACGVVAG